MSKALSVNRAPRRTTLNPPNTVCANTTQRGYFIAILTPTPSKSSLDSLRSVGTNSAQFPTIAWCFDVKIPFWSPFSCLVHRQHPPSASTSLSTTTPSFFSLENSRKSQNQNLRIDTNRVVPGCGAFLLLMYHVGQSCV